MTSLAMSFGSTEAIHSRLAMEEKSFLCDELTS